MKRIAVVFVTFVSLLALSIPFAVPVMAASMTINSDTSVQVVGVYNKAGGGSSFVDLSSAPLNALRAQEPKPYPTGYVSEGPEVTGSVWDTGVNWSFQTNAPNADWIWETERSEGPSSYDVSNPLYDAAAYTNGRVVVFEKEFTITGTPLDSNIRITADNCWEVFINGISMGKSATAKVASWWSTNLRETSVATTGWQSVGNVNIPAASLNNGLNTLTIYAANEYFFSDDGNNPSPALRVSPYYQYNPGAMIFSMTVNYDEFVAAPSVTVEKTATIGGDLVDEAGDEISYEVVVTNTGNVPLTGTLADTLAGISSITGPVESMALDSTLEVGETWTYTYTYTASQADIDNNGKNPEDGFINNTATFTPSSGSPQSDSEAVPVDQAPGIEVVKTVDPTSVSAPGSVTYTYDVTNTGNVTLTGITVMDDNATPSNTADDFAVTLGATTLAPGASTSGTAIRNISQADIDAGETIVNWVTADSAESAPDTDDASVAIVQEPSIDIEKLVNGMDADTQLTGPFVAFGSIVNYSFVVTNTGNVTLTNISVTDTVLGNIGTIASLAPGASQTLIATASAVYGAHKNTGTASTTFNGVVDDTDDGWYTGPVATRTQGFWQTHTAFTTYVFGLCPETWAALGILDTGDLFGAFYASIPKTTEGDHRSELNQAKMQLLQQLVAAKLDVCYFGMADPGITATIAAAEAAFLTGTDAQAIRDLAGLLDDYNNYGDAVTPPDPMDQGPATPKASKTIADLELWDYLGP
jgi:uncharacterized repeat protein (TIGR01451 family)